MLLQSVLLDLANSMWYRILLIYLPLGLYLKGWLNNAIYIKSVSNTPIDNIITCPSTISTVVLLFCYRSNPKGQGVLHMKIMHLSCNIAPIPRTISYGIIHMISPIGHNNVPKGKTALFLSLSQPRAYI